MDEAALFQITSETKVPPIEVQVQIDDCQVRMEVDTGATCLSCQQRPFTACGQEGGLKPPRSDCVHTQKNQYQYWAGVM